MISLLDYVIFLLLLLASMLIGIYFGSKQASEEEYLFGKRKMRVIPTGISVAASHFSSVLILGVPADLYRYGAYFWITCLSDITVFFLAVFILMPVLFKLQRTSCYAYLEQRFDKRTKYLAICLSTLSDVVTFPVMAYGPSLLFHVATGFSVHAIAVASCLICIFYTAIGGLRTVVWTDFLQFGTIAGSLVAIIVLGLQKSKGFLFVWETALYGGRLDVFNFDFDPTRRDAFWGIYFNSIIHTMGVTILSQTGVQKFLALPKFRDVIWCTAYFLVCEIFVINSCILIGLLIYAKYAICDPVIIGQIRKYDEIVPFYVKDVAGHISGIFGLFIAGVFSASLSSMSSNLNSISGILYNDVISKFLKAVPSERTVTNILKLNVVLIGCLSTSLVFVIEHFGMILTLAISLRGLTVGQFFGMCILGMMVPKANAKGCFYGAICGLITVASILLPAKYYLFQGSHIIESKPAITDGCTNWNQTNHNLTNNFSRSPVPLIFRISSYYYIIIGTIVTIVIGLIISVVTNKNDTTVDKKLISPVCHWLIPRSENSIKGTKYSTVQSDDQDLNRHK